MKNALIALTLLAVGFPAISRGADNIGALLASLKAVGREGAGGETAATALKKLANEKPAALLDVLAAFDGASPDAANWLRGAIEAIAERAVAKGETLPLAEIERFVLDRKRAIAARELAWEWLSRVDPSAPERLLPRFLDDPSGELRALAVARELAAAEKLLAADGTKTQGRDALKALFPRSRDPQQIEAITKKLQTLGERIDVTRHMGWVKSWRLLGPLEGLASERQRAELPQGIPPHHAGFHLGFPPETRIDLELEHAGKIGAVRWKSVTSDDPNALVDLNKSIGKQKSAVAFALAEVEAADAVAVEIRAASPNALKIWVNDKQVFQREEYHHHTEVDQHVAPARLEKGKNRILLKLCQNDQTDDWAQEWGFQLRVCDATGKGAL